MSTALPLEGIQVLDLTRNVAGPWAAMVLADLGATVIKVEHPRYGDDTRTWGPPFIDQESPMFLELNRNKQGICLDLSRPEAKVVLTRLVKSSDVMLESFRPGALDNMGLGYEWARSLNSRLIHCSVTPYGSNGPLKDRPGYDPLMQAFGGMMSITGEPGRPPVRVGCAVVDMGTGLWTSLAIIAALYLRKTTGHGDRIVTSLYETSLSWITLQLATYWVNGEIPGRFGSGTGPIVPYQAFPTRDGPLVIAAGNDTLYQRLCEILNHPEWIQDQRFRTNPDRVEHREELVTLVSSVTQNWTSNDLEEALTSGGVPCSPVRSLDQVAEDEQAKALGMFQCLGEGPFGDLPLVSIPIVTKDGRSPIRSMAPRLGEHSAQVLRNLGFSPREIDQLLSSEAMQPVNRQ